MIIQTISDTHSHHEKLTLGDCDMVIHAGDWTRSGKKKETLEFLQWYADLSYKHKVLVPGNHDVWVEREGWETVSAFCKDNNLHLLNDTSVVIDGIKIHGSPVTLRFGHGWAWNRDRTPMYDEYIGKHWELIPNDADIVICHQPCKGILDFTREDFNIKSVGCSVLREKIQHEIKPKLFVCGHIHESGGDVMKIDTTTYVNSATKAMILNWDKL